MFLGDIVGKTGRNIVQAMLPALLDEYQPDFVIANGENAAAGLGITAEIARQLLQNGVDGITLGNHAFHKKEIGEFLEEEPRVVRPANFPAGVPGKGWMTLTKGSGRLAVANFCGRVFMSEYDDPFRMVDQFIADTEGCMRLIDFHAEATSEKMAFAFYVDGRVAAVLGTHTHVQTADERILPQGTAFLSDVGMCGPQDSIIGMDKDIILRRFLTLLPEKFEVATGPGVICGAVIDVQPDTGLATSIQRIQIRDIPA